MRSFLIIITLWTFTAGAQTLGGNAVFSFLNLPASARQAALGGYNITAGGNDLGMGFQQPALLRPSMHGQVATSMNAFLAGIQQYNMSSAWYLSKQDITIAGGIQYLQYGSITQTDASGNVLGSFRPQDYVVQMMASKSYKQYWWLGTTLKYVHSNYGVYRSSGMAADISVLFSDTANLLQAAFLVRNLGAQFNTYAPGAAKEEMPFDIQLGITKKLAQAPLQFSLTAHQLQRFNIFYNDPAFNEADGNAAKPSFGRKLMSHLILSAQFFPGDKLEINTGYNFLRRNDLNVFNTSNGLNGFTMGVGLFLKRLHIRYATGFYQRNTFHQFSINLDRGGKALGL